MDNNTYSFGSCYPFDSVWRYKQDLHTSCIFACVLEVIFLVPITIENFLVIVGICKTRSLHSPANFLICALAFSDLGVGILALPFHLAWKGFLLGNMYSSWCISIKIAYGVGVLLAAVSLLTITAISIERTVALYMALRYELVATNNKIFLFTVITWISMALFSLIQFYDLPSYRITAAFISFVCFTISSLCCFKIYQVVRHHRTQIDIQENASEYYSTNIPTQNSAKSNMKERKRSSASMLCLYGLFLLCYTPYIGVQLVLLVGVDNFIVHASEIITVSIVFINSVLNPLLYCWRMREIRRAMMSAIPCSLKRIVPNITVNSRGYNSQARKNNIRRATGMSDNMFDHNNVSSLRVDGAVK